MATAKKQTIDELMAEVEACCPPDVVAKAKAMAAPPEGVAVAALPPGTEDLFMQIFLYLLNWWKSRRP